MGTDPEDGRPSAAGDNALKYYPPISQLISREALPADVGILAGASATAEQVLDRLLGSIRFKDLVVNQSADGDVKVYSLAIVGEELGITLPGTEVALLFFPGPSGSGEANIPLQFEWRWAIARYVRDFQAGLFSRSPGDFFDLFLKVASVSEADFVDGIVRAFVKDSESYVQLVRDVMSIIADYRDGHAGMADESGGILAHADAILTDLDGLIPILQDPQATPSSGDAAGAIAGRFRDISDQFDIELDVCRITFDAVTRDVSDVTEMLNRLLVLFGSWFGGVTWQDVEELLVPRFDLALTKVPVALEFPRAWLVPIDAATNLPNSDETVKSRLTFDAGSVRYSTRNGLTFQGASIFNFTPSTIGKTGLTLEITDAKVDWSRTTNIPEADAAGYPTDFVGVYIKFIEIGLPERWFSRHQGGSGAATLAIIGRDVLIGTGGFSGEIGLEALVAGKPDPNGPNAPLPNAELEFILGRKPDNGAGPARQGFKVGFSSFTMKFRQNVLLETKIAGRLTVEKFDPNPIDIRLFIAQDGDFALTASMKPPGHLFRAGTAFSFWATSLSVEKDDQRVFISATGDLSFEENETIGTFITEPIHLEKLRIYSDGSFDIGGGKFPLPESVTMPLGPATIAITAIHCGAHEQEYGGVTRKYRYWGFDGGISVDPGGIDAQGDGIKFYYTVDDNPDPNLEPKHHEFLRIEGIGIDLVIPVDKEPTVLLLQGYLALRTSEYEGSLSFQLPQLQIAGGASMKYQPDIPAWIVAAHLELPKPLPLGSTSLGIFGFSGLFGWRYVASKEAVPSLAADASWGDYYRADPKGISDDKFLKPDKTEGAGNPFSVGAGVSLATAADDGHAFSSQLFLLVSVPNLILLEGRGDVNSKQRVGLDDDPPPPYYAYLALSPDSIEIGAGAHHLQPKPDGEVLDLNAVLEAAFFFRNPSAWYVHLGTKAKPATARIISLFDAYAYLMLSASGIEAGAGASYDFAKKYGPVSVTAHAYLELWAYVSFERSQAAGGIALGGYVDLQCFGIGFHIEIATGLTVEVPKPFRVAGYVHICVSINLRIKKIEKCVDVQFVWERDPTPNLDPVLVVAVSATAQPAVGIHMGSGRTYPVHVGAQPLDADEVIHAVPLDTYIDVKLAKPVNPAGATNIGGFTNPKRDDVDVIPPHYGVQTVTHAYKLDTVRLEVWCDPPGTWIDYHPFAALASGSLLSTTGAPNLSALPIGTWQKQDTGYSQFRLLGLNPFSYMEPVGGYRPEEMGLDAATIFCAGAARPEMCVTWEGTPETGALTPLAAGVNHYRGGLLFRIEGEDGFVLPVRVSQSPTSMLGIRPGSRVTLQFPRPITRCRLALISGAPSVTLRFQRRKPIVRTPETPNSWPEYVDVKPPVIEPNILTKSIVYEDPAAPIDCIVIETPVPDTRALTALQEDIVRERDRSPAIVRGVDDKQRQLEAVEQQHCAGSFGGLGPPRGWECGTFLSEVCWLTADDWAFNQTIPSQAAVDADFQTMRDAVEKVIAPIWRPHGIYQVTLEVSDTVNGVPDPQVFYVHFRTEGALGHFDPTLPSLPAPGDDGQREIPERLLKYYIDMERSYPDPTGNQLYAKPLYYGAPVLRLFMARPYAYHFFADWPAWPPAAPSSGQLAPDHYEMAIHVKDPAESPPDPKLPPYAQPLVSAGLTGQQSWRADPKPRRTEDLKVLSNMRNPRDGKVDPEPRCWTVGGDPIKPAAKGLVVELKDLEPEKLYTAVVLNRHAETTGGFSEPEVHRYPFRTSRYRDFKSHIESYRLKDDAGNVRRAVFLVSHDLAGAASAQQDYAEARAIIRRESAAGSEVYPDFFDRLIHACLELAPLPPAVTLEFNFVKNALTQEIYGLWLRTPEPLNDARMPLDELRAAIRMKAAGVEQASALVLFSRDCCQAFVMTEAGAFPSQQVAFAFDHLVFDGKDFTVAATVQTNPFDAP
jgi:hypothetical protein